MQRRQRLCLSGRSLLLLVANVVVIGKANGNMLHQAKRSSSCLLPCLCRLCCNRSAFTAV
jgi:hypothetical protein